ncbi:MAG: CubicO group peptidase (beta-lactamase class C family) [Planctomycetota bacterium]|jgi:CubicO group peptidase (beta-lactamase class C family)
MRIPRLYSCLISFVALPLAAHATQAPVSQQRLDALVERLEAARVEAHIPGMSIAIVQDGEVVLARGFGLADVEGNDAADAATVFAIGSTTKAFTSTVIGMAVDEGKLTWDDPVTRHLPRFQLPVMSDDPKAECTLRDLLSHRHGFVRMSMLWMSGALSRAEVLERAVQAEPLLEFRQGFRYSNVAYLAAGEAVAAAMGESWDALVAERIFAPLGMSASAVSLAEAQSGEAALALGYRWDEVDERAATTVAVDLSNIAPSGAIYSNAEDMAQWISFLLGRGELGGKRLISEKSLEATWTPEISMGGSNAYGLGWMLHEYRGKRVVEHGGAVDGFTAQVTLLPDEGIGYVLLMNLDASPLREASIPMVVDALLGPDETVAVEVSDTEPKPAAGPIDLECYAGTYIANFAKFRDAKLEVEILEGRLQLTIPGDGESLLKAPDSSGRWALEQADGITVSFRGGVDGPRSVLVVHKGAFSFEVPREGAQTGTEVKPETLEPYVGTYRRDRGGKLVKLLVANGQLVMEDRGNWLAFHTPGEDGSAPLRARADQGATFTLNGEGTAESFVFRGNAGNRVFTRVMEGEELPSLRDVRALYRTKERSAALRSARGTKSTGTVRQSQAGLNGTYVGYTRGRDCYATHMDFGAVGSLREWGNGDAAWRYNPMQGTMALKGIELVQAQLAHPDAVAGDWRRHFDRVSVARTDQLKDRKAYVLLLEKKGLPNRFYWVDAETGDIVRVQQTFVVRGQRIPLETTFSNFREVEGIRTAHRVVHENPATGRTVLTIESIESGLELKDEVFTSKEAPGRRAAIAEPKSPK